MHVTQLKTTEICCSTIDKQIGLEEHFAAYGLGLEICSWPYVLVIRIEFELQ